jgi:hypothetical protein
VIKSRIRLNCFLQFRNRHLRFNCDSLCFRGGFLRINIVSCWDGASSCGSKTSSAGTGPLPAAHKRLLLGRDPFLRLKNISCWDRTPSCCSKTSPIGTGPLSAVQKRLLLGQDLSLLFKNASCWDGTAPCGSKTSLAGTEHFRGAACGESTMLVP